MAIQQGFNPLTPASTKVAGEEHHVSVCTYCGAGCKMNLVTKNGKVIRADAIDGVTNEGEMCLKGYFGWDFLNDTKILTPRLRDPMIRRQKGAPFEIVSWEEAIKFTADKLKAIKAKYGPNSIMHTGSSRSTGCESNYVMQRFARAVINTNNVDCCARVCHAPSMAGLEATVGRGAMSNSIAGIDDTNCVLMIGYNGAESHPIVFRRVLKAKQKGAKLIVCDPRFTDSARAADQYVPIKNGSNMAIVNCFAAILIDEDLVDHQYISKYTQGFEDFKERVKDYLPEKIEHITGVPAEQMRQAMRTYAAAENATILWGLGVTHFEQGSDTVAGLAALALMTGNLGRKSVGVGPVRGQNNVQGACDMGVWPSMFCGYQKVTDEAARRKFAKAWNVPYEKMDPNNGTKITEVPHKIHTGEIKAYYIMGEDPVQTEAGGNAEHAAFKDLELMIVQDVFMTKSAEIADVVLPATTWGEHDGVFCSSDRGFQRFWKAVEPPKNVKRDWEIISLLATEMGYPMSYSSDKEVWDEMRSLCPLYAGITYEKMGELGHIQWPCETEESMGSDFLFEGNKFHTETGKANFVFTPWHAPAETPDADYPMVLCTVREVGHYGARSQTGNCAALDTLASEPGFVQINTQDAASYGIKDQELVYVNSRRGKIITRAKVSDRTNKGAVYMTFHWWVGACNEVTDEASDRITKTPETKYCAVQLEKIADQKWAEGYAKQAHQDLKARLRSHVENAVRAA